MLLTQEGLKQVSKLRALSPTVAAAYIMEATEVASKVLTNGGKVVPYVAYLSQQDLPDHLAADFSFIHSLFAHFEEPLPSEIAGRLPDNIKRLTEFVWNVHRAYRVSLERFPGLTESWKAFTSTILLPLLRQTVNQGSGVLMDYARDLVALVQQPVFFQETPKFKEALSALVERYFRPLPPLETLAQPHHVPHADLEPPTYEREPGPPVPPEPIQNAESLLANTNLLDAVLDNLRRFVQLQEEINSGVTIETPNTRVEQYAHRVEQVYELKPRVLPTLANDSSYVFFVTHPRQSAIRHYAELVNVVKEPINALRKIAENAIRSDLTRELSSSGRLNTHLLPKALAANISPFMRIEPEEERSLHLVVLVDESGSMGTSIYGLTDISQGRSGEPFLGAASGVASNRAFLAKLTSIILYEGLKNADVRMQFFGYGDTALPPPLDELGNHEYVRELVLPYALATITHKSNNGDLSALSHAFGVLCASPAKHRVVIYLADGEISSSRLVEAFRKVTSSGIKVYWLDLSGRKRPYSSSALAAARRFVVNTFDDVLKAIQAIFEEVAEWYM